MGEQRIWVIFMKNGYMFFLNLGNVTFIARIFLIVFAIAFLSVDSFSLKVYIAIAFVISFAVSVIKAPSDKDVLRTIERFRGEFKEKLFESRHTSSAQSVKVIEAYKVVGKMCMKRAVGRDIIYPHLISLALAPSAVSGKMILYVDELCLLKKGDIRFNEYLVDSSNFRIETETDEKDRDVVTLNVKYPSCEEGISLVLKNDFHYRDFMEFINR